MFKKFDIKYKWNLSIGLRFFKNGSKTITFQAKVDLKYMHGITNEPSFLDLSMCNSKANLNFVKFLSVTWSVNSVKTD